MINISINTEPGSRASNSPSVNIMKILALIIMTTLTTFAESCSSQPHKEDLESTTTATTMTMSSCNQKPNHKWISGQCFYFEEQKMTFDDAQANCAEKGGKLFEPKSNVQCKLVQDEAYLVLRLLTDLTDENKVHLQATDPYWRRLSSRQLLEEYY